jgi:hypothetical protein
MSTNTKKESWSWVKIPKLYFLCCVFRFFGIVLWTSVYILYEYVRLERTITEYGREGAARQWKHDAKEGKGEEKKVSQRNESDIEEME